MQSEKFIITGWQITDFETYISKLVHDKTTAATAEKTVLTEKTTDYERDNVITSGHLHHLPMSLLYVFELVVSAIFCHAQIHTQFLVFHLTSCLSPINLELLHISLGPAKAAITAGYPSCYLTNSVKALYVTERINPARKVTYWSSSFLNTWVYGQYSGSVTWNKV